LIPTSADVTVYNVLLRAEATILSRRLKNDSRGAVRTMPHARFERWALVGLGLCVAGLYAGAALSPVAPVPRLGAPDGGMATAVEGDARPASARNGVELGKPAAVMTVGSTEKLSDMFSDLGYHLDRVRGRDDVVPRVFLASLPRDLKRARSVDTRKRVFLKALLPLVLKVNESILLERGRLLALRQRAEAGRELTPAARIWLEDLARRYGVETLDFDELLRRVDAIPPGLALAQGAEESGWGTSRFALEGNAPFGQWTFEPRRAGGERRASPSRGTRPSANGPSTPTRGSCRRGAEPEHSPGLSRLPQDAGGHAPHRPGARWIRPGGHPHALFGARQGVHRVDPHHHAGQ
jgi:hypothetical protein